MMTEAWKPIPSCPGYEASDHARVRKVLPPAPGYVRLGPDGVLAQATDKRGYRHVGIRAERRTLRHFVHRLVAEAFIGPRGDRQVNHKDGVKSNNLPGNLEYVTPSQNIRHAYRTGLMDGPAGAINGSAVLNESEVLAILAESGLSLKKIGQKYGVSASTVWYIKTGQSWSALTGLPMARTRRKPGGIGCRAKSKH